MLIGSRLLNDGVVDVQLGVSFSADITRNIIVKQQTFLVDSSIVPDQKALSYLKPDDRVPHASRSKRSLNKPSRNYFHLDVNKRFFFFWQNT